MRKEELVQLHGRGAVAGPHCAHPRTFGSCVMRQRRRSPLAKVGSRGKEPRLSRHVRSFALGPPLNHFPAVARALFVCFSYHSCCRPPQFHSSWIYWYRLRHPSPSQCRPPAGPRLATRLTCTLSLLTAHRRLRRHEEGQCVLMGGEGERQEGVASQGRPADPRLDVARRGSNAGIAIRSSTGQLLWGTCTELAEIEWISASISRAPFLFPRLADETTRRQSEKCLGCPADHD